MDIEKSENIIISLYITERDRLFSEYGYKKTFLRLKRHKNLLINDRFIDRLETQLRFRGLIKTTEDFEKLNINPDLVQTIIDQYQRKKESAYYNQLNALTAEGQKIFKAIFKLVRKYDLWFDIGLDFIIKQPIEPKIYLGSKEEFILKFNGTDLNYLLNIDGCPYSVGLSLSFENHLYNEFESQMNIINCFWEPYDSTTIFFFSALPKQ